MKRIIAALISMILVAAALAVISGLGFGLPGLYAIWNMFQGRGMERLYGPA